MPSHPIGDLSANPSRYGPLPRVSGSTELIFTVADPVAQVKAPQALNLVFAAWGVDALALPAKVAAADLAGFVRGALAAANVRGALVSIPHKSSLVGLLQSADTCARLAGAANAVRRDHQGRLEGALFDGRGFLAALRRQGVAVAGARVLLLGTGGAGVAIASALVGAAEPPRSLVLVDAAPARAQALAAQLAAAAAGRTELTVANVGDPAGHDLVVNATPLGLNPTDPLPLDVQRLPARATVVDILMKDRPTALERACADRGIAVHSGHEMLVQQIPDYLDFFGFGDLAGMLRQPDDPTLQAVRDMLLAGRTAAWA